MDATALLFKSNPKLFPYKLIQVIFLKFKFQKANDYPIDMYYLLDFSNSMAKYKNKLANIGTMLLRELQGRTSQLQIGFGSFVDKVTLPFTDTRPEL